MCKTLCQVLNGTREGRERKKELKEKHRRKREECNRKRPGKKRERKEERRAYGDEGKREITWKEWRREGKKQSVYSDLTVCINIVTLYWAHLYCEMHYSLYLTGTETGSERQNAWFKITVWMCTLHFIDTRETNKYTMTKITSQNKNKWSERVAAKKDGWIFRVHGNFGQGEHLNSPDQFRLEETVY